MFSSRNPTKQTILVNQSYRMQRMTGQQRYAHEIASRLRGRTGYQEIAPEGIWSNSALRVWAWIQLILPTASRGSVLLSMTARAPAIHSKQVLVVHDLFVLTNPEWFSRKYVLSHAPLLRAQLAKAAGIIAVSAPVADQVAPLYSGPIVVAPNAPSEIFAQPTPANDSALSDRGLTAGTYFLAVGSIDPRKNLPRLAEAYGQLSAAERAEAPLVVVGGGSAIYKNQSIHWPEGTVDAGFVSDEQLRALYAGSRAVVFVSLAEGFGLPLVEAAAAGAQRLVISDIAVFRWICGDSARYVDPHAVSSITEGLRAALTATPQDGPLINLARFDWDTSAGLVATLCEAVRDGRAPTPPPETALSDASTTIRRLP
jgi:glycosyltransferase involved in cell wall biosynthesis